MGQRLDLQAIFESIEGASGVYFQAPPNLQMTYPCIRYNLDEEFVEHADNFPYQRKKRYKVTVLDNDPDSTIAEKVAVLSTASFERTYAANGLNHFVYNLYF